MSDAEIEPVMVTLTFETATLEQLTAVLAKYVVVSRGHEGCRNIDLVSSTMNPGRLLIVEKWDSIKAQQAHFDSADMVEMAEACQGILSKPPQIDLHEGISMHDLA